MQQWQFTTRKNVSATIVIGRREMEKLLSMQKDFQERSEADEIDAFGDA